MEHVKEPGTRLCQRADPALVQERDPAVEPGFKNRRIGPKTAQRSKGFPRRNAPALFRQALQSFFLQTQDHSSLRQKDSGSGPKFAGPSLWYDLASPDDPVARNRSLHFQKKTFEKTDKRRFGRIEVPSSRAGRIVKSVKKKASGRNLTFPFLPCSAH